jgi:hypothetical protein
MGFLIYAIVSNGSLFGAAAAPGEVRAAAAFIALAVGSLAAAVSQLTKCTEGRCGTQASVLAGFVSTAIFELTALAAALVGITILAAIPFVGATVMKAILLALLFFSPMTWLGIYVSFLFFWFCTKGTAGSPVATAGGAGGVLMLLAVLAWLAYFFAITLV